jgi:4-hydroxybenzoate polyprenyltransferase
MSEASNQTTLASRLGFSSDPKLFLGLSRTPHGLLDLATPALGAMLWLGGFPPLSVIAVGLIAAFAGYTAVYALNDLIDCRVDRERLSLKDGSKGSFHVDEIMVRHPIARGLLPFKSGFLWFAVWSAVALAGAWWLNPFCAALFLGCAFLETLYCKLLRITWLKIVPSALVKASGGIVGVFAVDPCPSWAFLTMLFLWLAAWEVGGQNIANDIVDLEDDKRVSARTTATALGVDGAMFYLVAAASMAALAGVVIYFAASPSIGKIYPLGAAVLGWALLMAPTRKLYDDPGKILAAALFNRASYLPWAFLLLTIASIYSPF